MGAGSPPTPKLYMDFVRRRKKQIRVKHTAKRPLTRSLKLRDWSGTGAEKPAGVGRAAGDVSTRYLQNSSRDCFRSMDIYNLYKVPREQGHLSPPLPQAKTWSSQSLDYLGRKANGFCNVVHPYLISFTRPTPNQCLEFPSL